MQSQLRIVTNAIPILNVASPENEFPLGGAELIDGKEEGKGTRWKGNREKASTIATLYYQPGTYMLGE